MMLSFAIPIIIVHVTVYLAIYPYFLEKYRDQIDYSWKQSVQQVVLFLESYLQNMKYLAEMIENNGSVQTILSSEDFTGTRSLDQQYQEFYFLNKEFSTMEFSNPVYRFGLYVPDDIVYSGNDYYFYAENMLKKRGDYGKMLETFATGRDYAALGEGRQSAGSMETDTMLTLFHQIMSKDGMEKVVGVCSISIALERFIQVMENANITSGGLVYLVDNEGTVLVSSEPGLLELIGQRKDFSFGDEIDRRDAVKLGEAKYYAIKADVGDMGWQMISLVPTNKYDGQYIVMRLLSIALMAVVGVVIIITSSFLSGYYINRLKKLRAGMQYLQGGNLNTQLPLDQNEDEIEEVYRNFNYMVGEVRRLMQEHYQLGKNVKVAEIRALQAQINPHFLYNTLDLVNWIAMDYGASDIEKIAWNLSRFYRLSLNHGKSLITIGEELEHVQVYVNIQRFHYDNAVQLIVEVPEELCRLACLNIILQPFVENAIVHGIAKKMEISECIIQIWVEQKEDDLIFRIRDNGPGMTKEQMENAVSMDPDKLKEGYGIKNINYRIKLYFGEKYGVRYESVLGKGTTAFVQIPALTMEEAEKIV